MPVLTIIEGSLSDLSPQAAHTLLQRYPQTARDVLCDVPELNQQDVLELLQHRNGSVRAAAIVRKEINEDLVREHLKEEKNGEVLARGYGRISYSITPADAQVLLDSGTQATYALLARTASTWAPAASTQQKTQALRSISFLNLTKKAFNSSIFDYVQRAAQNLIDADTLSEVSLEELGVAAGPREVWLIIRGSNSYSRLREHQFLGEALNKVRSGHLELNDSQWAELLHQSRRDADYKEALKGFAGQVLQAHGHVSTDILHTYPDLEQQAQLQRQELQAQQEDPLKALAAKKTPAAFAQAKQAGHTYHECLQAIHPDRTLEGTELAIKTFPENSLDILTYVFTTRGNSQIRWSTWSVSKILETAIEVGADKNEVINQLVQAVVDTGDKHTYYWAHSWAISHGYDVADLPIPLLRECGRSGETAEWVLTHVQDDRWDVVEALWDTWQGTLKELYETAATFN